MACRLAPSWPAWRHGPAPSAVGNARRLTAVQCGEARRNIRCFVTRGKVASVRGNVLFNRLNVLTAKNK